MSCKFFEPSFDPFLREYNTPVVCNGGNCRKCGWNPIVAEARKNGTQPVFPKTEPEITSEGVIRGLFR